MIRATFLAAFLLCWCSSTRSQGTTVGSSQLKIPVSARSAALGESTVAHSGEFSAWFINPASLFSSQPFAVSLTHSQWTQNIQSDFLAARIPVSSGSMGLGVSTNSVPGIEVRDVPGPALGTFSARFASFQIGYAQDISPEITLGASAKYVYEKIYVDEATGFGLDAGIIYITPVEGLSTGFSLTNLGSLHQFQTERSDLPSISHLGASYAIQLREFGFVFSGSWANNLRDRDSHFQGSCEGIYDRQLALRIGYQTGYEFRGVSAGLGIHFEFLQLDYAYVPFSLGLGNSHFFSLGFQF